MIVISGPSCVGKNVAITALCRQLGGQFAVPITTRPPRLDERSGVDYHFVEKAEFQRHVKSDNLDEWDFALGHYYGFLAGTFQQTSLPGGVTHSLARMALRIRRRFKRVTLVFLLPSDSNEQVRRLEARFPDADERRKRLDHWHEELAHAPLFDHQLLVSGGSDVMDIRHSELWEHLLQHD